MVRFVAFLSLLALLVCPLHASNWPRFRGENGTGISSDKDLPVEIDGSKPLWKIDLKGGGNASPIVWEGKIFLQEASDDASERSLNCYSLADGKLLWSKSVPGEKSNTHKFNSQASGTPCTDGQRIYVPIWNGVELSITAFDFKGEQIWTRNLGKFACQHGPGHSPIVYKDKVILLHDQDGSSVVIAFDSSTGKTVWEAPRTPSSANFATPAIADNNGTPELIVTTSPAFTAYDPDTGKELWNYTWANKLRTVGSPVIGAGVVVVGSGNGGGNRNTVAVKCGGTGDVTASHLAWTGSKAFPYVPCMLMWGEQLFTVNDRGVAYCHLARTGEQVWEQRLGGNFFASPVMVDEKIYAINDVGDLYVIAAGANFKQLHKTSLNDAVMATPAVADSKLIVRSAHYLSCYGK